MLIILNIQVSFLIFFTVLYTDEKNTRKENVKIISDLLKHSGWKKLTEIKDATYCNKKSTLNDLLKTSVTSASCDTQIRRATVILGCTYAYVLKIMFHALIQFQNDCKLHVNDQKNTKYAKNCTMKLINITNDTIRMSKIMKGALDALENYHHSPWQYNKKTHYILSTVISGLQQFADQSNQYPLKIKSSDDIKNALNIYEHFFILMNIEIEGEMKVCKINSPDSGTIWNLWENEYKYAGVVEEFYKFITGKLSNLILSTFNKKYHNLGFIYVPEEDKTILSSQQVINNESEEDDVLIDIPKEHQFFNKYIN
ncbi:uncharacterized protein LOC126895655 [Daktulosphaira vitifoliae]|uniref:uncharacterized protein LOC126895655 n=1 Tax=Daktulosphaira vitifoliae TaxID=58002 RepID=UPI0021AA1075|nr:uncharacterized protein LOC126895655 [Daktulosphaira vitifoliae]